MIAWRQSQNLICLAIAAAVVLLLFLLKPSIEFAPKGIVLPTKTHSIVSVMLHSSKNNPNQADEKKVADYALELAHNSGANAIVIKQMFYSPPKAQGKNLAAYSLKAIAITAKPRGLNEY